MINLISGGNKMELSAYYTIISAGASRKASSYSRLRALLSGLIPNINSLGILTGWNPGGQPAPAEYNRKANFTLMKLLRNAGYGPIKIKGKFFGSVEDSFLVPNMKRGFLLDLCSQFDQYGVIYGERTVDDYGNPAMEFSMLDRSGSLLTDTETVVIGNEDIHGREDMFSFMGNEKPREPKHKGQTSPTQKKFFIPFWDDKYSGARPGQKPGEIQLRDRETYETV